MLLSESKNFGGDGCDGNQNLGNDEVSETTLRAGAGWGTTTVDCGVNSNVNVIRGEGGFSGVSMAYGTGIVRLISVVIIFIAFFIVPK